MTHQSKVFYLRIALCTIIACVAFPLFATAEEQEKPTLFNKVKKESEDGSKTMKTMSWNPPEKEKEEEVNEEKTPNSDEEKITKEQELWEKYKKLAAGGGAKQKSGGDEEKDETESSKDKDQTEQKKPGGIASILDNYKNAQKSKGAMNSRSFGSID